MNYNIKYQTRFENFTDIMKQVAEKTIGYNVQGKMTPFWEKYLTHPDAEALVKVDITRDLGREEINDKTDQYHGVIEVIIPWGPLLRHERTYRNVEDFINNSFKQFKEQLT